MRLRKIKYKDGRCVEIFNNVTPTDIGKVMLRHAAIMSKAPDLAGYAIVSWGFDGWRNSGWRIHDKSQIGETMMPAIVKDVLVRNVCDPRESD